VHSRPARRAGGAGQRIARKGIEPSHRLGRHRWVVERTVSWLAGGHQVTWAIDMTGGEPALLLALLVNQYLCPRSKNLMDPARRLFTTAHRVEIFSAHKPPQHATVDLGCSFGSQNLQASPAGLRATEERFIFPGHSPGGASSRRHGVRTVRIPV
jgi:hypothetical protein